jgi:hypothetical protein
MDLTSVTGPTPEVPAPQPVAAVPAADPAPARPPASAPDQDLERELVPSAPTWADGPVDSFV